MKPHKHAELIKAWADGAKIQWKFDETGPWMDFNDGHGFYSEAIYRIKPRVGMRPKDNQIRMRLGFRSSHLDESFLYCEDELGNWLDPLQQLGKFADDVRYDERMTFFGLLVAKGYSELALQCNREMVENETNQSN